MAEQPLIVVREYDEERHKVAAEKLEKLCEVGQRGKPSIVADLMGDPICRIRHFSEHVMLVAEHGEGEIVGMIRGSVKTVRVKDSVHVKLVYLLGLRVSPTHRNQNTYLKMLRSFAGKILKGISRFTPKRPPLSYLDEGLEAAATLVPDDVMEGHFAVLAIKGEESKRFIVELEYLADPAFMRLLDKAKEEYGFRQKGALAVPCRPQELQKILDDQKMEGVLHRKLY